MKYLFMPFFVLYRLYFAIVFFLVLFLLYPVFALLLRKEKNFEKVHKLKVFTAKLILFLQFYFIKKTKNSIQKPEGTFVVCANHQSYLDIIAMYPLMGKTKFLFLGKSELLHWPLINIFFRNFDIAIDRNKRHAAMRSIELAKDALKKGWSIVIFPEGGIFPEAPEMVNFKNGAFKMALDTGVPILPLTIVDNWKLFDSDNLIFSRAHPGISRYQFHEPIPTESLSKEDLIPLRSITHKTIEKGLIEAGVIKEKPEDGNK